MARVHRHTVSSLFGGCRVMGGAHFYHYAAQNEMCDLDLLSFP